MAWTEIDSATTSPTETDIPFFYTAWAASTAYAVAAVHVPTTGNGLRYSVQSIAGSGTSGASEPTWPTRVGSTVVDNAGANQITWVCAGPDESFIGRVTRNCNNLPYQHPHFPMLGQYVNEAKDEILTMALSIGGRRVLDWLVRLQHWRWYDITVNAQAYLPLPERMLWLDGIHYTKSTSAFVLGATTEYESVPIDDSDTWGLLNKSLTGWPTRWRRAGSRVEFHPTPTTAFLTYVVATGTRRDIDLSAASDTLLMDPQLQAMTAELATAITMEKMGWEQATARRTSVETRLTKMLNVRAEESTPHPIVTRIAGTPR